MLGPRLVLSGYIVSSVILAAGMMYLSSELRVDNITKNNTVEIHPIEKVETQSSSADGVGWEDRMEHDDDCALDDHFPQSILRWCWLIEQYAEQYDLEPALVAAVIWVESNGEPLAYSSSGAVGLMQIMPRDGLAATFQCVNGPCFVDRPTTETLWNAEFNIAYGTRLLSRLLRQRGNVRDALRSYGPMGMGYVYADRVIQLSR